MEEFDFLWFYGAIAGLFLSVSGIPIIFRVVKTLIGTTFDV